MDNWTLAEQYFTKHRDFCETWTHGGIMEVWRDASDTLCVKYADGCWWHYKNGEWW